MHWSKSATRTNKVVKVPLPHTPYAVDLFTEDSQFRSTDVVSVSITDLTH
jgi:hypothetical protein